MKYFAFPADQLSPSHVQTWSQLVEADPALDSPYFRPDFTLAVAAVRRGTQITVLEDQGSIVGFLPYHRDRGRVGSPVADSLTDFQAAIVAAGTTWEPAQLVRDSGLSALYLDRLLVTQRAWAPYWRYTAPSPYLDLAAGFDAYRQQCRGLGSNGIRRVLQKQRKLEREVGPTRLEHFVTERRVFRQLIAWKMAQCIQTGARNVLEHRWTVELLDRIVTLRAPGLSGILSVLYAGDTIAAIHLGMVSSGVLHYWFPVYNPDLARYSPGLIQLVQTAQGAADMGLRRIDLGTGPERFKYSYMTGQTVVAEASVDFRPMIRSLKRAWLGAQRFVRQSSFYGPALSAVRGLRRTRRWSTSWLRLAAPGREAVP